MAKNRLDGNPGKIRFSPHARVAEKTSSSGAHAAASCPRVLVVGPGPAQVGGVATFIQILMSSPIVRDKYELIRLDTTRAPGHVGLADRFSILNLSYLVRQTIQLIIIALRQRPRLMHLPVTSRWAFWKSAIYILIGKALGMKIVAHLHGGMFDRYYRQSSKNARQAIGWVLSHADVVIALSERWQRFLLEEVRPDLHVEVMRNTVDTMFAQALDHDESVPERSENQVLFVGALGQRKGVFDILQAVPMVHARRPDAVFLFAGDEDTTGVRQEIDKRCAEKDLNGSVHFLGSVTGRAKLRLFRQAALFILPSHGENLPYALLEAMAAGLPVITTPVGAIPEIVEDDRHGFLIQPGDYADLARRIVQLLDDGSLRQRMSGANRQLIRDCYLPDVAMTRLVAIYDRLQVVSG